VQFAAHEFELVRPIEFARESCFPHGPESFAQAGLILVGRVEALRAPPVRVGVFGGARVAMPTIDPPYGGVAHQPREFCRQVVEVAALRVQSVDAVANDLAGSARGVDEVRFRVRPRFQQHQPERIRPRRQRERIDAREEVPLLAVVDCAEPRHAALMREGSPERFEVRHARPGEHDSEPFAAFPQFRGCFQQIDCALLDTRIREMADDRLMRGSSLSSRAFARIDAEALQHDAVRVHSEVADGVAFQFRLHEDAVGLMQQPSQVRGGVLLAGAFIPQVQERREEERHPAATGEPQPAHDRERVRERGSMHGVERAVEAAGIAPHRRAHRVARRREALQRPVRDQRECLEDVAPSAENQWSVPARARRASKGLNSSLLARRAPEVRQLGRTAAPSSHVVPAHAQMLREPCKVRLRTSEGGRASLDEVRDVHKLNAIPFTRSNAT